MLAYVAALALGIATHLFSGMVLIAHVAVVGYRGELSREWVVRWALAVFAGCAVYVAMAKTMAANLLRGQGRLFDASFPVDTAREALGHEPFAVAVLGALVAVSIWQHRRSELVPVGIGLVALVALLWLGPSPSYLAPRFFVSLVPAVAVACAAVVARWPVALVPVVGVAAGLVAQQWSGWGDEELPNRVAAAYARRVQLEGGRVCGVRYSGEPLWAYAGKPVNVLEPTALASCEMVVAIPSHPLEQDLIAHARRMFPHSWRLHATVDMIVFSRSAPGHFQSLPQVNGVLAPN